MTMNILNADYWSTYVDPYVADLGVALLFGVGYYLFKNLHKNKKPIDKGIKETIAVNLNKWAQAKTAQKFNSLIITNRDKTVDAFTILNTMSKSEVIPDIMTYNCLLDMSLKLEQFEQAKKLHEEIADFTSPVQPDVVSYNILLKGCVLELKEFSKKSTILEKVKTLMKEMKNKSIQSNDITYNTAIDACIEAGDFEQAWSIYTEMKLEGKAKPDNYTYATLIKGLKIVPTATVDGLEKAMEILEMVKSGQCENLHADEVLYNSVLDTCVKFQKIEIAENLFQDMKSQSIAPTLITYSIMIKGYGVVFKLERAVQLFEEMKAASIQPNQVIYGCLLNCAARCGKTEIMSKIYENLKEDKIESNHIIYTTLIKGFNKMKQFEKAFDLFDEIMAAGETNNNIVVYNSILDVCVESQNFQKLTDIFEQLKKKSSQGEVNCEPNIITYSTVIKGFSRAGKIATAIELYEHLKSNAYQLDEVLFNTVAEGLSRSGQHDLALKVLDDMKAANVKRTSVIYSIFIKMYALKGDERACVGMFDTMIKEGIKPSLVAYTTFMQMYIKKKKIANAIEVFTELKNSRVRPDHVTYNFIVNGCCFNQKLEKAIEFMHESLTAGVRLNEETYNNVLEYLINNKFMKHHERVNHAKTLLKELKDRNLSINYDLYSRLMKLVYNESATNLSGSYKNGQSKEQYSGNKQRETLQKTRKHYYK